MTTLANDLGQLHQTSPIVYLYEVDMTKLGGSIMRFTPNVMPDGSSVVFYGYTYLPLPVEAQGFDRSSKDTQASPTLALSNVNSTFLALLADPQGFVNAKVRRGITKMKFLDGQPAADSTQTIWETYYVFQTAYNKTTMTWQLASPLEAFGQKLPARQFLKDKGFPGIGRIRSVM